MTNVVYKNAYSENEVAHVHVTLKHDVGIDCNGDIGTGEIETR